ncbi:MAG: hypothetical protein NT039_00265 [Candidatus Berkelbacteria bacterium]|nr:hypothetical protein [Candidatus Berkelbacteria bacterium]
MPKQKMTLDKLARMMNNQFGKVDKRSNEQDKKIDKLIIEVIATREDVNKLKDEVRDLKNTVNSLVIAVDKLAKSVENLTHEYSAINVQIKRHEEWIKLVANKVGVKLEI